MCGQAQARSLVEAAIKARGADVYAGFLLPHLRSEMTVLDCGCGKATITLGLADTVLDGWVVGVDLKRGDLIAAGRSAVAMGRSNVAFIAADCGRLPFHGAAFDAVLCHSMLETAGDPANVVAELRRVTKRGGVVGPASVEYGGVILAGEQTAGPQRFSTSVNNCGGQQGSPSRIWAVVCVGFSRQRGSVELKRSPTTSATGRQIGSRPLHTTEPRSAAMGRCMSLSHATE